MVVNINISTWQHDGSATAVTMSLHVGYGNDDSNAHDETQALLSAPGGSSEESSALRIATAMYSFAVLGLCLSTIGVMLPHIEDEYGLSDSIATATFVAGPAGYLIAAQCNSLIHARLGQRGIALLGPLAHVIFAAGAALRPPYAVFLLFQAVGFFGTGLLDGSWCAWAGAMDKANTVSGLLHGSFSVGAAAGPLMAGAMLSAGGRPWFEWYYVLVRLTG
jgi:fucose permease